MVVQSRHFLDLFWYEESAKVVGYCSKCIRHFIMESRACVNVEAARDILKATIKNIVICIAISLATLRTHHMSVNLLKYSNSRWQIVVHYIIWEAK